MTREQAPKALMTAAGPDQPAWVVGVMRLLLTTNELVHFKAWIKNGRERRRWPTARAALQDVMDERIGVIRWHHPRVEIGLERG